VQYSVQYCTQKYQRIIEHWWQITVLLGVLCPSGSYAHPPFFMYIWLSTFPNYRFRQFKPYTRFVSLLAFKRYPDVAPSLGYHPYIFWAEKSLFAVDRVNITCTVVPCSMLSCYNLARGGVSSAGTLGHSHTVRP
jgi:hypothetical protein